MLELRECLDETGHGPAVRLNEWLDGAPLVCLGCVWQRSIHAANYATLKHARRMPWVSGMNRLVKSIMLRLPLVRMAMDIPVR